MATTGVWLLFTLALCWGRGAAFIMEVYLDKRELMLGDMVSITLIVDPRDNVVCIVNFGDDDCVAVVDQRDFFVEETVTRRGGFTDYTYTKAGSFQAHIECQNNITSREHYVNIQIAQALSGVTSDQGSSEIQLISENENLHGTLNFSYTEGTFVDGYFETDEGKNGTVSINETTRTGFAAFEKGDFILFGAHAVDVTLMNLLDNSNEFYMDITRKYLFTLKYRVLYDEKIDHIVIEGPSLILVDALMNLTFTVGRGSRWNSRWVCGSMSADCWGQEDSPFLAHSFRSVGEYVVSLVVENNLGTKEESHTIGVLSQLSGFSVSVQPPNTTTEGALYLHHDGANSTIADMGEIFVEVRDDSLNTLLLKQKLPTFNNYTVLIEDIPTGDRRLHIQLVSNLSTTDLEIEVSIAHPVISIPLFSVQSESLIILPDGVATFSLSLEPGEAPHNNTDCEVDFGDSTPTEYVTMRRIIAENITHVFSSPGSFVIQFTCETADESSRQNATVNVVAYKSSDFLFSYPIVSTRNSTEANTSVMFNISLLDLAKIPKGVGMEWNFGDGTVEWSVLKEWKREHTFKSRGKFDVNVTVVTPSDTHVFRLPVKIGVLDFWAYPKDTVKHSFKFTISGAFGETVHCFLDFGDNTSATLTNKSVSETDELVVSKTYQQESEYHPHMLCWSEEFSEAIFLPYAINVTEESRELNGVVLYVEPYIVHPPGRGNLHLLIPGLSHSFIGISLWCSIDFHDGSPLLNINLEANSKYPFLITHTFLSHGRVTVDGNCSADNNTYFFISNHTHIVNSCYESSDLFPNLDSIVQATVAERVTIAAKPNIQCLNMTPEYLWRVEKDGVLVPIEQPNSALLVLPPRSMVPGMYKVFFYVSFSEIPTMFTTDSVFLEYEETPLQVNVKGGTYKVFSSSQPVVLDAGTVSYDPDVGRDTNESMQYSWSCASYSSEAEAYHSLSQGPAKGPSCTSLDLSSRSLLVITPGCLLGNRWHVFHVTAKKGNRTSINHQIVHVLGTGIGRPPQVDLRCKVNCLDKVDAEFSLSLESECLDCRPEDWSTSTFSWALYSSRKARAPRQAQVPLEGITSTGWNISTISIRPNSLKPGFFYTLELTLLFANNRSEQRLEYSAMINYPPYNGSCFMSPPEGVAVYDLFQVTCADWLDEGYRQARSDKDTGDHLTYQFVLTVGNKSSVLFSGGSRRTSWQELNPGDPTQGHAVVIVVRIFDRHKGMAQVNITGRVFPPLGNGSGVVSDDELDQSLTQFQERISKSLLTRDVHQIFRTAEATSTALNCLALQNNSPNLEKNLDKLLGGTGPELRSTPASRGLSRNDSTGVSWGVIWGELTGTRPEDQKDKVIKATRGFAYQLSSSLTSSKPQSLAAVHMVATATQSIVSERGDDDPGKLGAVADVIRDVGEALPSAMDTEMSDVHVSETLDSIVKCVGTAMGSMLKEGPIRVNIKDIQDAREAVKNARSYYDHRSLKRAEDAQEKSDIQDEEIDFILTRTNVMQQHKLKIQEKLVKSKMPALLKTIDRTLDVASTFLVEGQEPATFSGAQIAVSVEKNSLERIMEEKTTTSGVSVQISANVHTQRDSHQQATLKTTVLDKNAMPWGAESAISSPVARISLRSEVGSLAEFLEHGRLSFTVDIPNPAPVTKSRVTPEYLPLDWDQMLYHRTELHSIQDSIVLHLKPSAPGIAYDVFFRSGEFPTSSQFDFSTAVVYEEEGSTMTVKCPPASLPSAGTIYIGLKPRVLTKEMSEEGTTVASPANLSSLLSAPYTFGVSTVGCRQWDDILDLWNPKACLMVDPTSDLETRCKCEQSDFASFTVGTTFYVPVNTIDFSTVFTKIDLLNNSSVLVVVISLLCIYLILSVWARRKDKRDALKWGVTCLQDNHPDDGYHYILTVHTGMRVGAGTESRVGFVLAGEKGDTGIRVLSDGVRKGLTRQSILHFLMTVPTCLGDLQYLRVWHDNSGRGSQASWFLHKLVVEDIQRDDKFVFYCGRWLGLDKDDGAIDRLFPVSGNRNLQFRKLFYNNARKNVSDKHLWFSVLLTPPGSCFSRFQRLSCCLCLLFLTMISNALFFHSEENIVRPTAINIGVLRFSLHQLYVSVIGILIVTPVNVLIVWLFTKARPMWNPLEQTNEQPKCQFGCFSKELQEDREKLASVLIAKGLYDPNDKKIPHFCVYIAWAILVVSTTASAFFLLLYSQQWGEAKSEEWLTSFLMSFVESLLVVDPLKVILIAVTLALFVRKPDESIADGLKSEIKSKKEDNRKNVSAETGPRAAVPPLPESELEPVRTLKKKETKASTVVKEILLYLIFLVVIYTVGYTNRDTRSFNVKNNIYNMMVYKQRDRRPGLVNVITVDDYFSWLNHTAIPAMFHDTYDNGSRRSWRDRYYMRDLQNFRVGPPRLRQIRGQNLTECERRPIPFELCNTEYRIGFGESTNFCIGWKERPCPAEETVKMFSSAAWQFTDAREIWGTPLFGRYNTYSGGGYIAELDVNKDLSMTIISELYTQSWIDRQSRAVALEFTVYNANANIFCYVSLLVEFPETGGTLRQSSVLPFRLYQHVGALGSYIVINEVLFLVFLLTAVVHMIMKFRKHGFAYMKERWHVLDLLCILASFVGIAVYGVREVMANVSISALHDDPRQFVNFQHIALWDEVLVDIIGVVSAIVTVRTLNILGYSRRVNTIMRVLTNAGHELLYFSIIFFIVFLAFVVLGYLLFGTELEAYHTFLFTCATLMTSMIGKTPFDEMRRTEPLLAQFYFVLFVFFVVMVLLTMFLAILNDSIAAVRASDKEQDSSQQELLLILFTKLLESLSLFFPSLARRDKAGKSDVVAPGSRPFPNTQNIPVSVNKIRNQLNRRVGRRRGPRLLDGT